jgi:hypothetical protein
MRQAQPAEHFLLRHRSLFGEQLSNPIGQVLVIGHEPDRRGEHQAVRRVLIDAGVPLPQKGEMGNIV